MHMFLASIVYLGGSPLLSQLKVPVIQGNLVTQPLKGHEHSLGHSHRAMSPPGTPKSDGQAISAFPGIERKNIGQKIC
jgi:hypothetical protein